MKFTVNTFSKVLLPLTTLFFVSCTFIDNDLRDLPDIPGFKEVVVEDTEDYHLEYQFKEDVNYLDDTFQNYVSGIDYDLNKLYLYDYVPDNLRPSKGDLLFSPNTKKFQFGVMHNVTNVEKVGDIYVVSLTEAVMEDVYKVLVLKGEFDYNGESQTDTITVNEARCTTRGDEKNDEKRTEVEGKGSFENAEENDWNYVSLFQALKGDFEGSTRVGGWMLNIFDGIERKAEVLASNSTSVSFKTPKSTDAFSVDGEINGGVYIRWRPACKTKVDIDTKNEYSIMQTSCGLEVQTIWNISGYLEGELHLLKVVLGTKLKAQAEAAGKKTPFSRVIPIVPTAALNLILEPDLDLVFGFEGQFTSMTTKKYYLNFMSRKGVKGQKDGTFVTQENPPLELDKMNKESEKTENSGKLDAYIGLNLQITVKFGFSDPTGTAFAGIVVVAKAGPKFSIRLLSSDPYNDSFDINWHWELYAKATLQLTSYLTYNWYFIDTIVSLFGDHKRKETQDHVAVILDFLLYSKRAYPEIKNFSVLCTNAEAQNEDPKFKLSFDIGDHGFTEFKDEVTYPVVTIYKDGDKNDKIIVPIEGAKFNYLMKNTHYEWDLNIQDCYKNFDRESTYCVEIEMMREKNSAHYKPKSLYTYTYYFAAKPIGFITADEVTYMGAKQKYRSGRGRNQIFYSPAYFDWVFRTVVNLAGTNTKINGFEVNGKLFEIDKSKKITGNKITVIWKVNNTKNSWNDLYIEPITNEDLHGPIYFISLDYDKYKNQKDPEFGVGVENGGWIIDTDYSTYPPTIIKDYQYRVEKMKNETWAVSGFDKEVFLNKTQAYNVNATKAGSESRQFRGYNDDTKMVNEDPKIICIELDDLSCMK